MSITDKFSGAKTAYISCFSYITELMNEMDVQQVYALMTKSDRARGIEVGKSIKEESGGKDFDVNETLQTIIEMATDIGGVDVVLENTPTKAVTVTEFGKCPIYEAAKTIGMNDQEIEALCRASSLVFLDNVVKQLNPKLTYSVGEFRSVKYGGCVEIITLDDK